MRCDDYPRAEKKSIVWRPERSEEQEQYEIFKDAITSHIYDFEKKILQSCASNNGSVILKGVGHGNHRKHRKDKDKDNYKCMDKDTEKDFSPLMTLSI